MSMGLNRSCAPHIINRLLWSPYRLRAVDNDAQSCALVLTARFFTVTVCLRCELDVRVQARRYTKYELWVGVAITEHVVILIKALIAIAAAEEPAETTELKRDQELELKDI